MTALPMYSRVEQDLNDARTGERPTFLWTRLHLPQAGSAECERCGVRRDQHAFSSTIPFCPEWALRELWGL